MLLPSTVQNANLNSFLSSEENQNQRRLLSEGVKDSRLVHLFTYVLVGLIFGMLMREVKKKTDMPYTPLVLGFGIIFGFCG